MVEKNKKIAGELSDEEYWKQFTPKIDKDFDGVMDLDNVYTSMHSHDIDIDVAITFRNMNGVIFQSKEKNINCSVMALDSFFSRLKKQIRLLDETKGDSIGDGSGGF